MSRELDARVAKGMGLDVIGEAWARADHDGAGWFVEDREREGRSLQPVWVAHCVCEFYPSNEPDLDDDPVLGHYPGCFEVVAHYSTDDAAMWQLVRWMRAQGWFISIEWDSRGCSVWVSAESKFPEWAHETEPAEAICLAFLAAMEATCEHS